MKASTATSIIASISLLLMTACSRSESYRSFEGVVWHTTFHITYRSASDMDIPIVNAMNDVEMSLSPFQKNSVISRINRCETDSVDPMITTVFNRSQQINTASNGMFDPTVAPLVNLWGFGYETPTGEPTEAMIDSCLQLVGISDCSISDRLITKKHPDTQFNFSAITKGFGCDVVASTLRDSGCNDFMVEIGGELVLSGSNPQGKKWRVMIDAPVNDTLATHHKAAVIEVTDCAIATSGNYRNYHETSSGRVGHTISPLTGRPVQTEILSATVISRDAMTADALATASMTMPLSEAQSMISGFGDGTSALFILAGEGDTRWITATAGEFPTIY